MVEIERKFLVTSEAFKSEAFKVEPIIQGYLNSNKKRSVRIRIKGEKAYLTIKGESNQSGISRLEWEKEIDRNEAEKLIELCEEGQIAKKRYNVKVGKHTFEVDVFEGQNEGLIIAEVELENENETFEKPDWLGNEVSQDHRYFNVYLSQHPFKKW